MKTDTLFNSGEEFFALTPDHVMNAVEQSGLRCTGRCLSLSSMENRVYEMEIEKDDGGREFVVSKFYRPNRWTKEQILEEHEFLFDLEDKEIPVVAPLKFPDGESLKKCKVTGIYYCLFPKKGGRSSDELTFRSLEILGRQLGRLHLVGRTKKAQHRLKLNTQTYFLENLNKLSELNSIEADYQFKRYENVVLNLEKKITPLFEGVHTQRIHGDCHLGNLIWRDDLLFFIDFDDFLMGPAVQDFWLIFPWDKSDESFLKRDAFLNGYEQMCSFDWATLKLIEPLRAMRFVYYSTWIAKRYHDPIFKKFFPHFGTSSYWEQEIRNLEDILMTDESNP